ncbi:hypothetical protein M3Y99_01031300 [Aphelenchoides fujianensis]|nr:hypothetical protein M3Y99_01031300 [Aphelenchoides fujianensis]
MLESELRSILSSLSHLAASGDVPVQAFATLIRTARTEILAEHLHQRWLSNQNFGNVVAKILSYSHNDERRDMKLCSQVLSLVLDDYRHRYGLQKDSRLTFRNYCRTLIELLPVYLQIDRYMGHGLVKPLFDSLHMLIDEANEDDDFQCIGQILVRSGTMLSNLNPTETDRLAIKVRQAITFYDRKLACYTRFVLLNAVDLWTYQWNSELMPMCLFNFYSEQYDRFHSNDYGEKRWLPVGMKCRRLLSDSSLAAGSSASSSFSQALSPEPLRSEEPESIV